MLVVDVETTGIDPLKNSIVSIGALDFFNPKNQFYVECKIWDGAEIVKEALAVNGFTGEQVTDPNKNSLEDAIRDFIFWSNGCKNITLAGEVPGFDENFLKTSARRYGLKWEFDYRAIDVHTACYIAQLKQGVVPPEVNRHTGLTMTRITEYVGLPDEPKPHHALTGAKIEAEVLSRLIYGKPLLEEFKRYPIPKYLLQ